MQQSKWEVRTFMPDYGDINERRNQLHEVIRLSGLNVPISDNDHPLVVKVASMQPARIQVYFMDNDDYFQKQDDDVDAFGTNRADNDERAIFYAHTAMETARKLQWETDILQVSGWISALAPLYFRTIFKDDDTFHKAKLVYTIMPETPIASLDPAIFDKLEADGIPAAELEKFREVQPDHNLLHKMAIEYADEVVFQGVEPDAELTAYCEARGKKYSHFDGEGDHADDYRTLYTALLE